MMMAPQKKVCVLFVVCLLSLCRARAQGMASDNARFKAADTSSAGQGLRMVTIGHGRLSSGHWFTLKIYEAPDGSQGQIIHARFDSLPDADALVTEWLKMPTKVITREQEKKEGGNLISDRIVAEGKVTKPDKRETIIVRRDGLNCYLIQSLSLQVATQIENMIHE